MYKNCNDCHYYFRRNHICLKTGSTFSERRIACELFMWHDNRHLALEQAYDAISKIADEYSNNKELSRKLLGVLNNIDTTLNLGGC